MTEETKKKIGRSKSLYKDQYAEDVVAFFEKCLNDRTKAGIVKNVPSYVAFARSIGVTVRTIENWRKSKKKFAAACDECDALLKETVIGDCLGFKMHASFGKFLLSSRYGMKEEVKVTHEGDGVIELSPEMQELLDIKKKRGSHEDQTK